MQNNKTWILLGFMIVVLAGGGFVFSKWSFTPVLETQEKTLKRREHRHIKTPLRLGYGWSTHPNVGKAVGESVKMLLKTVAKPRFVLVFFTDPYNPQKLRDSILSKLGKVKLLGLQSANGVFTPKGLHSSPNGALAILGFQGKGLSVGVAGADVNETSVHAEVARKVIDSALKDGGQNPKRRPDGIITGQVLGFSEIYSSVLNKKLPSIPMVGGNQITNTVKPGAIIVNQKVYKSGFAMALLYASYPIGTYFHGGFMGRTKSGVITKVDPKNPYIIIEIDHRPALDVYNGWAKGAFTQYLGKKKPVIVNNSVTKPLAKALKLADGSLHYLTLHPWKFNPDKSFNGGIRVSKGERIHYVEGNEKILIKRSGVVARKAMVEGGFPIKLLAGGVHIYCVGAGLKLGIQAKGLAPKMVNEIKEQTHNAPFIGGFFGGEQGRIKGHGYFAGNLMSAMMVFSKKSKAKQKK